MSKTDYDKGRTDGFCSIEPRYPNNANYMLGHAAGCKAAEREYYDTLPDYTPQGPNDTHANAFSC
jgi:hypothetical protein